MKIWIDLTNSPHVNFFKPFIERWSTKGHTIILTCRDLSNTIDLLNHSGWDYYEIGKHAGKNIINKIIYFPKRVYDLRRFLMLHKPDLAVSHSSFYSPIVGWLLNIPTIYINDNEHAKGNYIAFLFASIAILPDCLREYSMAKKWPLFFNIDYYPGLKEGIYLHQRGEMPLKKNAMKTIYFRPEPWSAQYYKGEKHFIDEFLVNASNIMKVIILPRSADQADYYSSEEFRKLHVCKKPPSLLEIVANCDLFIGAGGTMTRELALLSIPTISIYHGEQLEVDKFLIKKKLLHYSKNITVDLIDRILQESRLNVNNYILLDGKKAFEKIYTIVENYDN